MFLFQVAFSHAERRGSEYQVQTGDSAAGTGRGAQLVLVTSFLPSLLLTSVF